MPIINIPRLKLRASWLAVLSGLLYGLLGYFGMMLLRSGLFPTTISFWRFFVSFLFLLMTHYLLSGHIHVRSWWHWQPFMLGALFYSGPSSLFFIASKYIGTGQSMVIFFSFPVMVMVLNRILYKENIKPIYFISFIMIISGLLLLIDMGEVSFDLLGIGLSLLSAISYAFYVIFSKTIKTSALISTLMVSLGCAVTSLLLSLLNDVFQLPNSPSQWLNIIGIAVICTAIPILLMLESLKYISSAKASLLSVLEPVFTVIFGVILLNEVMTIRSLCGVIITLLGGVTASFKTSRPKRH